MSQDPHAPTPAGPDPDEKTEVRPPVDAFAAPVADEPTEPTPTDELTEPTPAEPTPTEPTPTVSFADATDERPAGTAAPADDWLAPDAAVAAAPATDPPFPRDPTFAAAPGTAAAGADPTAPSSPLDQAKALTERPEVMVGLAFAGGVVASFVLKRFGR